MTWQEELRQLDAALANGEVSAGDYRKRRDEILAAASSAQSPAPSLAEAAAQAKTSTDVDNTTELADQTQTINTDADATQIVAAADNNSADSTQVVGAENTQVVTEADQTQIITKTQQAPTWASHLPDPAAQTGAFARPSQTLQPAMTPTQAHDVFGSGASQKRSGKGWLIAVIVVLVLALGGGAAWWFLLRDKDNGDQAGDPPPATSTQQTEEPPPAKNVDEVELPGEPAPNTGELTMAEAKELKVIGAGEADLLAAAGITELTYAGSSEEGYRYLLYSYPSDDPTGTTDTVNQVQEDLGLTPAEIPDIPDGVSVAQLSNTKAAVLRAVYPAGDQTIQLLVLQVPTGSAEELSAQFNDVLATVIEAIPPSS